MKKRISVLCLLLAAIMVLSMMAGCAAKPAGGDVSGMDGAWGDEAWGDDIWADYEGVSDVESSDNNSDNDGNTSDGSNSHTSSGSGQSSSSSSGKLTDKEVTLKVLMRDTAVQPVNEKGLKYKVITEKTGIKLDIDVAPEVAYSTKVNTVIASGQIPDIIEAPPKVLQTAPSDMFIDIGKVMKDKLPNYYRWVKDDENLNFLRVNGKMYGTVMLVAGDYPLKTTGSSGGVYGYLPVIRYDILDENNLKTPTTLDEWFNVMKTLKAKYPDSTPWSGRAYYQIIHLGLQMFSGYQPGITYDYDKERFTVGVLEKGFNRYVEFAHRCYEEGILDQNFMTANYNTWEQGVIGGKVFFWTDNNGYAQSQTKSLQKSKANAKMQVMPLMSNFDGEKFGVLFTQHEYAMMYALNNNSKNKDLVLKFMNWCYSDEGMYVNNYGKEGVTYKKNANGSVTLSQNLIEKYKTKAQPDYSFGADYGVGQMSFCPLVSRAFGMSSTVNRLEGDTYTKELAKITAKDQKAGNYHVTVPGVPYLSDDSLASIGSAIDARVHSELPKFINGTRKMSEWNTFISEIKNYNPDKYLKAVNDAIK